ncbi:MAG TPA: hypothetical protein VHD37_02830 [Candidatus Paceibacterota bacterium]|nr:hypothetical protein [Candidatus Paceibacterota bacterium]
MSDASIAATDEAPWEPETRRYGQVEISVNYQHEITGRRTFDAVSPKRLLELMDKNLLVYQMDGGPRPEHIPSRAQLVKYLGSFEKGEGYGIMSSRKRAAMAESFADKLAAPSDWKPSKPQGNDEESDPGTVSEVEEKRPDKRRRPGKRVSVVSRERKIEALMWAKQQLLAEGKDVKALALSIKASEFLNNAIQEDSMLTFVYTKLTREEKAALRAPPPETQLAREEEVESGSADGPAREPALTNKEKKKEKRQAFKQARLNLHRQGVSFTIKELVRETNTLFKNAYSEKSLRQFLYQLFSESEREELYKIPAEIGA